MHLLKAFEVNDICESAFNQSADLYDLRVFDFAEAFERAFETETITPEIVNDLCLQVFKKSTSEYGTHFSTFVRLLEEKLRTKNLNET